MLTPSILASLAAVLLTASPQPVDSSPNLTAPTIAFAVAVTADWASTYHAITVKGAREVNPQVQWIESPSGMVAFGAAMDVGGYLLWRKLMKKHPKWAAVGLYAMAAWRGYLAYRNIRVRSVR